MCCKNNKRIAKAQRKIVKAEGRIAKAQNRIAQTQPAEIVLQPATPDNKSTSIQAPPSYEVAVNEGVEDAWHCSPVAQLEQPGSRVGRAASALAQAWKRHQERQASLILDSQLKALDAHQKVIDVQMKAFEARFGSEAVARVVQAQAK